MEDHHAFIRYDTQIGELVLMDSESKYGTLILIQRPLQIYSNKPVLVQNGLSIMRIEAKTKRKNCINKFLSCLKVCGDDNEDD